MIALYASQIAPPNPTGVHRVVSELVPALHALHPDRYRLLSDYEKSTPEWVPPGMPVKHLPRARRVLHRAWYRAHRPRIELFSGAIDLLHILYPTYPVPSRAPLVQTIHDLQYLDVPEAYDSGWIEYAKAAFQNAADNAAKIVTSSSVVAGQIAERLGIDRARIAVVYHGVSAQFRRSFTTEEIAATCHAAGVESGRYLIYVGTVEVKKNLVTLLRALARRGPGARLVLAGQPGRGIEEITAQIEALGLERDVVMTGRMADAELPRLMAGAIALLHPSRHEGFGLPPLEAMSVGIPVLAARAPVLEEVLGGAAEMLDPDDADSWAGAMSRIERDRDHAVALASKGKRYAEAFTWERAGAEVAAVHEAALKG